MNNFKPLLTLFENFLQKSFYSFYNYSTEFKKAISYSFLAEGKRLRPLLYLTLWKSLNKKLEVILPFAAATECIHCYSLVHDDLPCMDNDDYRRGKLSTHKKFGECNALLTGNALLTEAVAIIFKQKSKNADLTILATQCLLNSAAGMLDGQYLDMNIPKTFKNNKESYAYLQKMQQSKTACLFQSCFEIPAILAELDKNQKNLLIEIGKKIGICYQLKDDILDQKESDEKNTPKADYQNNKITYLELLGEKKTYQLFETEKSTIKKKIKKLQFPHQELEQLIELVININ